MWRVIDGCLVDLRHADEDPGTAAWHGFEREALACLTRELERNPDSRQLRREVAGQLQDMGDVEGALTAYQQALDLHPRWSLLHSDVARYLAESGSARTLAGERGLGDAASFATSAEASIQGLEELRVLTGVRRGDTVADVGCGCGRYSFAFARWVGPGGKVWAQDILADYLNLVGQASARMELSWIEGKLGTERDARLPAGSVDIVFLSRVWVSAGSSTHSDAWLRSVVASLAPGGRLVVTGEPSSSLADIEVHLEPLGLVVRAKERFVEEGETWIFAEP